MENILLIVDAIKMSNTAIDFACFIGRLTSSKVTGVFLENFASEEKVVIHEMLGRKYLDWEVDEDTDMHKAKMEVIERNITYFKEACINREINCNVYRDRGQPNLEVISESRFADVLIVDSETSFKRRSEGIPSEFIKEVLQKAECPVIIAPESFERIDEIVFTYDESASSVFAIKQFTFLFPQLQDKKIVILQVNDNGEWQNPDKYKFNEWLKKHYTDIHFEAEKGASELKLFESLFKRENIFLVMGAYGRSSFSQFFKPSHAQLLMRTLTPANLHYTPVITINRKGYKYWLNRSYCSRPKVFQLGSCCATHFNSCNKRRK